MHKKVSQTPWTIMGLLAVIMLLSSCNPSTETPTPIPLPSHPYSVQGYLVANVREPGVFEDMIFVPGVKVWLHNQDTNSDVDPVLTNLSGHFYFPPQEPGLYQLCWEADGFIPGCGNTTFTISDQNTYLGPVTMPIDTTSGGAIIFGSVRFADGSVPRTLDLIANVNAFVTVNAVDGSGTTITSPAYVNTYGDYILPNANTKATNALRSEIEKLVENTPITAGTLSSGSIHQVDITVSNHPPKLEGVMANTPGGNHWTAAPGDKIELIATSSDEDGDGVQYRWVLPDGAPDWGDTITYTLPNIDGKIDFTVIAYDENGGYAKESVAVSTIGVRFAGKVSGTDALTISGAEVEINGQTTETDDSGYFQMFVKESSRYVLNIRKSGYGLVSKVYDGGLIGGRWTLPRATVSLEDPTKDISVVDERSRDDCLGSISSRTNWKEFPAQSGVEYQDGKGNTLPPDERKDDNTVPTNNQDQKCGPGIGVKIPANSLVDVNGNPPPAGTMVEVSLSTVDLESPDGMPGDYTALDQSGLTRVMQSYGAGFIEISAGGMTYNLAPGAKATVIIPIAPSQLAAPGPIPNTIPVLFYDETSGNWVEEDVVGVLDGDRYVAEVSHFSEINMDVLKVNQACVRVDSIIMPPTFKLEVTVPLGGGAAPRVRTVDVDNSGRRFHVIYNLPTTTDITLRTFDSATLDPITPTIVVNTGGPQTPTDPNRPPFPYDACENTVELVAAQIPGNVVNQFLFGLYGFNALNLDEIDPLIPADPGDALAAADNYYDTVDPLALRETLDEFKLINSFSTGLFEADATYANRADLGFGREMHCVKNGLDVACYVTNYGDINSDDDQDFIDALNGTAPIATVGMEYSRIEVPGGDGTTFIQDGDGNDIRFVKFYVYKEALGNGRAPSANLDGFGERPIPQLCMICHGGELAVITTSGSGSTIAPAFDPSDPTTGDLGANFIPFDIYSFELPTVDIDGPGPAPLVDYEASQQPDFKQLNQDIVAATIPNNPGHAILDVINAMYAGGVSDQVVDFVVPGWVGPADQEAVYTDVISPSCAICHAAQADRVSPTDYIAWDDSANVAGNGFIDYLVCDQHIMPHALATYRKFWLSTSPHQPLILHDFLNGGSPPGTGIGSQCIELLP